MFLKIEQAKNKTSKIKSLCYAVRDAAQSDIAYADLYAGALDIMLDQLIELENELSCIVSEMGKEKAPGTAATVQSAKTQCRIEDTTETGKKQDPKSAYEAAKAAYREKYGKEPITGWKENKG